MNATQHLTLAVLRDRAKAGDRFAANALRVYRTDAQLQAACKAAKQEPVR